MAKPKPRRNENAADFDFRVAQWKLSQAMVYLGELALEAYKIAGVTPGQFSQAMRDVALLGTHMKRRP
jgi:hypothetical protein